MDTVNHTVTMSDAVPGVTVKETELVSAMTNAILTNNHAPIAIPAETVEPEVKGEHLQMIEITA